MARIGILVALTMLVLLVASGCISRTSGSVLEVSAPSVGDWFRYGTPGGSVLDVEIASIGERRDAFGARHETVVLHVDFNGSRADAGPFGFEEAVDLTTGLIVQQVALCGIWASSQDTAGVECYDGRAAVYLAPGGLPGAFGMGPLWLAGHVPHDRISYSVEPFDVDRQIANSSWTVTPVETPSESWGAQCAHLKYDGERIAPSRTRQLPWTMAGGSMTICEDVPLPVAFSTVAAPTSLLLAEQEEAQDYALLAYEPGEGDRLRVGATQASQPAAAAPALKTWDDPLFVDSDSPFPFSTLEAHLVLMENESAYARLFHSKEGMVTSSLYYHAGGTEVGPNVPPFVQETFTQSDRHVRILEAIGADESRISATVEKNVTNTTGSQSVDYAIRSLDESADGVYPQTIYEQMDIAAAQQLGANLTQSEYGGMISGFQHQTTIVWWSGALPDRRSAGYEIVIRYSDPDNEDAMVQFPYIAAFDGPTGGILQFHTPRTALPH